MDEQLLITAAWFHDKGYVFTGIGHEEQSADIAFEYLKMFNLPVDFLPKLERLIKATKSSAEPSTLLEEDPVRRRSAASGGIQLYGLVHVFKRRA